MEEEKNRKAEVVNEDKNKDTSNTLEDNSDVRTFGILGYIIPPLFFIPLLNDKFRENEAVRFHANQQMILLMAYFAIYVIHQFASLVSMSVSFAVWQTVNLGLIILAIIGARNAYKGVQKELPVIGHYKVMK